MNIFGFQFGTAGLEMINMDVGTCYLLKKAKNEKQTSYLFVTSNLLLMWHTFHGSCDSCHMSHVVFTFSVFLDLPKVISEIHDFRVMALAINLIYMCSY